jgi:two-component system chemotaxis sensor kinase CheA
MENNELISYRGGVLPMLRLSRLFGIRSDNARAALVIGEGNHAVGIAIDRVMSKREIVVRTLDDPLVMTPGISGATELGDGRVVMILEPGKLIHPAQHI